MRTYQRSSERVVWPSIESMEVNLIERYTLSPRWLCPGEKHRKKTQTPPKIQKNYFCQKIFISSEEDIAFVFLFFLLFRVSFGESNFLEVNQSELQK